MSTDEKVTDYERFLFCGGDPAGAQRYAEACQTLRASWTELLTDAELSEAIESTGHLAAKLYADGVSTDAADAKLDDLIAEFERRH